MIAECGPAQPSARVSQGQPGSAEMVMIVLRMGP